MPTQIEQIGNSRLSRDKSLRSSPIPLRLQKYIDHLAILINCAPQAMLLAIDLNGRHTGEDFITVEGIAKASMLSLQSAVINGSELDTPQTDRFPADRDASFCEEIFNIAVA